MIEIVEIDGVAVSMAGDYYETLLYLDADGAEIREIPAAQHMRSRRDRCCRRGADTRIIEIKAQRFLDRTARFPRSVRNTASSA